MEEKKIYVNLRYCIQSADSMGVTKHPKDVMKKLDIKYQYSVYQSIYTMYLFFNCFLTDEFIKKLPVYIKVFPSDPIKFIGFGLDEKTAQKLSKTWNLTNK